MGKPNVYIDTSVIGGCNDDEFKRESEAFLNLARTGRLTLLVSDLMLDELENAPDRVRQIFEELPRSCITRVFETNESMRLRDAYLHASVLGPASIDHVAIATVSRADMIASWNFRHLVNVNRMHKFNEVNAAEGYPAIAIHSPVEFTHNEED